VVGQVRTPLQGKPEPSPQMGRAHPLETGLVYDPGRIELSVPADMTILQLEAQLSVMIQTPCCASGFRSRALRYSISAAVRLLA